MIIELERRGYFDNGTFGILKSNGFQCVTVEEVWRNNQRSISCIPIGVYPIRRGKYPRHGECFEVLNVPNRTSILIHPANTIDDIEGCIGPGERFGMVKDKWAVLQSTSAYQRFMNFMTGVVEAKLRIYNYQGGVL